MQDYYGLAYSASGQYQYDCAAYTKAGTAWPSLDCYNGKAFGGDSWCKDI
jgi:hypothetical protein